MIFINLILDSFPSIQQLLKIEELEDDSMLYQMGLNYESSSDNDSEDEDGNHAAEVHNNNKNMDNDSQQTQEQQHEEAQQPPTQGNLTKKRELSLDRLRQLVDELLTLEHKGKFPWGTKKMALRFGINRSTLHRI